MIKPKTKSIFQPIIGITIDSQSGAADQYSRYPWYAIGAHSSNAVLRAGGVPILLPYAIDEIEIYCNLCDGIIISGGDFDISPSMYNEEISSDRVGLNEARTSFEIQLLSQYFSTNKPILGICGGMQLLNVYLGGTLIQHIPDEIQSNVEHEQAHPKAEPSHYIECKPGSKFLEVIDKYGYGASESNNTRYMVNSTHHQAVKDLGRDLSICATADDDIIEAIAHQSHPFCIATQWHPEFGRTTQDIALFKGFINSCQKN